MITPSTFSIIRLLSVIIFSISFSLHLVSQNIPDGAVIVKGDSLLLVGAEYRGYLYAELSYDLINWYSISASSHDTITVFPDTTQYVRLVVIEGTCNPVYSDTAYIKVIHNPVCKTLKADSITPSTALCGGQILDDGESEILEKGVYYDTLPVSNATLWKIIIDSNTYIFRTKLTDLLSNTKYYVRALAENEVGISLGNEVEFTTKQIQTAPVVEIVSVDSVGYNDIFITSEVTENGGSFLLKRGVCWDIDSLPDMNDNYTSDGMGTGTYVSHISGLDLATTYYIRAYAINSTGTAYSDQVMDTTEQMYYLPTVETLPVTDISSVSAICVGYVSDDGNTFVTERGFCWDTLTVPDLTKNYIVEGNDTGVFECTITGLKPNTKYYVRAFATNSQGTSYGNEVSFTTEFAKDTLIDERDGQIYVIITIGNQIWMAENLNFGTNAGSYYYNDSASYANDFGRLYTWTTALYVCPAGWRLPSDEDWKELEMYLGMSSSEADSIGWRGTDQGDQLKEGGSSGFDAKLGGRRAVGGPYLSIDVFGYYWTATDKAAKTAIHRNFSIAKSGIKREEYDKAGAFSIRCVKDIEKK